MQRRTFVVFKQKALQNELGYSTALRHRAPCCIYLR